jgi:PAS domain S-box-containing protein
MNPTANDQPSPSSLGTLLDADWLLDTLPWAVLVVDAQRIVRRINHQAVRWCSVRPATLLGRPLAEVALVPNVGAALEHLLKLEQTLPQEVFLPQSGQWITLAATQQPKGWLIYGQDITLQKQREQQYQALAENTPDALTRWTPDLRLRYANAAFVAAAAAPLNELLGHTNREMGQSEDQAGPYMAALQRVFDTGQVEEYVSQELTPQGEVYYHARLVPELRDGEIETVLGITRDVTASKQAEQEALRLRDELAQRAIDKYHALFYAMDQGFCLLEILFDETGQQALDYRYLELNPVFAQQLGIPADAQGKTIRELRPDTEPFWFDTFGRVARTGTAVRLECYLPQLGCWFDVHAFQVAEPEACQVAVLFTDITERKRHEANLAFLADLNVELMPLLGTEQVMAHVATQLAEYLHLSRFHLAVVDPEADRLEIIFDWRREAARMATMLGMHRISDNLTVAGQQHFSAGQLLITNSGQTSPLIERLPADLLEQGFGSFVDIPHLLDGRWRFLLTAARAEPGAWRPDEVELLRQLATRIYTRLERAQAEAALQSVNTQLVSVLESTSDAFYDLDAELHFTYINRQAAQRWGRDPSALLGQPYWQAFPQVMGSEAYRHHAEVQQTGQPAHFETVSPVLGTWLDVSIYPGRLGGLSVFFRDITARKQAEEALRASQATLSAIFEALPVGVAVVNTQGQFTLANRQMQQYLPTDRMPSQDVTQYARWQAYHSDGRPLARTEFPGARALRGEKVIPGVEMRYTLEEGRDVWTQVIAVPLPDARGHVGGQVTVILDIDARKRAEEDLRLAQEGNRQELEQQVSVRTRELQQSRHLLQTVFDASPTAIVVLRILRDAAGRAEDFEILLYNEFNKQLVGRDDLAGQRFSAMFPQTVPTGVLARLLAVATSGEPADFENWYVGEGMQHWFRHIVVRQDSLLVMTSEVITARKQAEQERTRNLRLLEQAEAVANLGSWDYNLLNQDFLWSDGMYQLFGLPLGQPVRPDIYLQVVVDEDRPQAERLVAGITAGTHNFEETLRLRVGEQVKTVRIKVVVLDDGAGQAVRMLGVDLDISELQRLETDNLRLRLSQQQALFEAVQEAEEEERRRMSESLHNGIGQILYATKLQLDYLPSAPELSPRHEAARLLGEAIRQTRSLSHELTPALLEEFGLEATLRSICRNLSQPTLRWHCHLVFEEGPALPLPLQLAVYRLAQELAQNVVKHAQASAATLEAEVLPAWVVLRVEDNGRGFDPTHTSDGLGLRSLRSRVALLGGHVQLTTAPGEGTQCQIRLPLAPTPL